MIRSALHKLYTLQLEAEQAEARRTADINRKAREAHHKKIANEIRDCFPNRERIKGILARIFPWDRLSVMSFLPEEIREIVGQMFGLLMPSTTPTPSSGNDKPRARRNAIKADAKAAHGGHGSSARAGSKQKNTRVAILPCPDGNCVSIYAFSIPKLKFAARRFQPTIILEI